MEILCRDCGVVLLRPTVASCGRKIQPVELSKNKKMGLPQLETCCFIFDLKTGNIILGCLNAVLSFSMCVVMIVTAATVNVAETEFVDMKDVEMEAGLTGLYVMCIILVLMFVAKFLFDIAFVYGVVTERAGVIKAYFIMWIVFFFLSMFIFFLNVLNFSMATTCTELFYIGLNVYMILLSHSYYQQLNLREEV